MTATAWQPLLPLLDRELAARARAAVEDVAAAVAETAPPPAELQPQARAALTASLSSGAAGRALLFAYLARATGEERWADVAERLLDEAAEVVATSPLLPGLYSGWIGPAWVTAHLEGRLFEVEEGEDLNAEIDDALAERLARTPWAEPYDLIGGLVGSGVYALERLPRPSAVRCLELVLERLAEMAEPAGPPESGGLAWFTRPELLLGYQREQTPHGYYNLGVAHGVPGVVALLARACVAGVGEARARPLLDGAVAWVLSQDVEREGRHRYPFAVGEGFDAGPTRLAWCYGDPGIAAALLAAARATGRPDWQDAALAIARRAAAAELDDTGVIDAGLCHGAIGLAHLWNRLWQATGAADLGEAARRWYEIGLEMRSPERGIAGFAAWDVRVSLLEPEWVADPGFLTGAAGVGLALLAATSAVEPEWDRALLLDLPPRA